MFSILRRAAFTAMVSPILKSIRSNNPPHAQRVLARFVKARNERVAVDDLKRKEAMGDGAARAALSAYAQELAVRRRLREQRATCEGEPDLAALLLEEYYVISLLAQDVGIWATYDRLLGEWYAELGGIEITPGDRRRAQFNDTLTLAWLVAPEPTQGEHESAPR